MNPAASRVRLTLPLVLLAALAAPLVAARILGLPRKARYLKRQRLGMLTAGEGPAPAP